MGLKQPRFRNSVFYNFLSEFYFFGKKIRNNVTILCGMLRELGTGPVELRALKCLVHKVGTRT